MRRLDVFIFHSPFLDVDLDERKVVQRGHVLSELLFVDVGLQENVGGAAFLVLISGNGLVQGFVDLKTNETN